MKTIRFPPRRRTAAGYLLRCINEVEEPIIEVDVTLEPGTIGRAAAAPV